MWAGQYVKQTYIHIKKQSRKRPVYNIDSPGGTNMSDCFPSNTETIKQSPAHPHTHAEVSHSHTHGHTHTQTRAVINRLSRAIGHLEAVKRMVENGQDCSDVLIQLAAVRSALTNTGKIILKDHLDHCIVDAIEQNDPKSLEQFKKAIDQFIK